jgi:outer membrane protein assembly factor BamB
MSYPLIADGKVFVNVIGQNTGNGVGTSLYALDAATGAVAWGPISNPSSIDFANSAYDDGKIYVVNADAILQQFDAETGAPGFKVGLGFFFDAPPVASRGIVYVGGGSRVTIFPMTGMAAGEGLLVVPAGNTLTAWKLQ